MTLGNKIYQLRTKAGLSQEELAEQMDVSRQSVSKWETDASIPELDKLIQLSKLFGITLDNLVRDEAEQPANSAADIAADTEKSTEVLPDHTQKGTLSPRRIVGIILFTLGLIGVFVSLFFLNDNTIDDTAYHIMFLSLFCIPCGLLCTFVKKHLLLTLVVFVVVYAVVTAAIGSVLYNIPNQFVNIEENAIM